MTDIRNFKEVRELLKDYIAPVGSMQRNYILDRMVDLMGRLDNPQDKYKVVHIAGTSGKTSTAYYSAALLRQAGKKVGLSVSPHVDEINERLQINLIPLEEKEYCKELTTFIDLVNQTGIKPTYFELLVAFTYWAFARQNVDYAVIEVGLGGLLDGTNVITRSDKVSVITDIGLDHTSVLGSDLASIAAQKAGIILPNSNVFCYRQTDEVMTVFRKIAAEKHATLHETIEPGRSDLTKELPSFQKRNWFLALIAVEYIIQRDHLGELTDKQLTNSTNTYIPARMEVVEYKGKTLIFDGSHNQQKLLALSEAVKAKFPDAKIAVEIGVLEDKLPFLKDAVREIAKLSHFVIATSFVPSQDIHKRALDAEEIEQLFLDVGFSDVLVEPDPVSAFKELLKRDETVLLVTGSFYLLNYVRPVVFSNKMPEDSNNR